MEINKLTYYKSFAGLKLMAANNSAQVMTAPYLGYGTVYNMRANEYQICTGWYYGDQNFLYLQTTNGLYAAYDPEKDDWKMSGYADGALKEYTTSQAQHYVDGIIRNNWEIVKNNLICARYANKFTKQQRANIVELQKRVNNRQNVLKEAGICDDFKTSSPEGYAELGSYLDTLMKNGGVGIATWAIVLISATIIAGLGTAAYYAYKQYYDQSEADIKYSKELMAVLAQKLTPEEYNQLLKETKGIVTKAKIKQALGSYGNVLKWAVFAFAGYAAYRVIKNNM